MKVEPMTEAEIRDRLNWLTNTGNHKVCCQEIRRLIWTWIVAQAKHEEGSWQTRLARCEHTSKKCDWTSPDWQRAVAERVGWKE